MTLQPKSLAICGRGWKATKFKGWVVGMRVSSAIFKEWACVNVCLCSALPVFYNENGLVRKNHSFRKHARDGRF